MNFKTTYIGFTDFVKGIKSAIFRRYDFRASNENGFAIIIAILALISATALLFELWSSKEGFDTVPLVTDPNTKNVVRGYYKVTESKMSEIPYGFAIDPCNQTHIIPITKNAIARLMLQHDAPMIKRGEKMPDTFYLVCLNASTTIPKSTPYGSCSGASLAILPPNMSPNLVSIDFSGNPSKVIYYYEPGYISQTQYYENQYAFPLANKPSSLPKEVYYVDPKQTKVSLLQYGQIADPKGYGAIKDPGLTLNAKDFNYLTSNYRDIKNNYNTEFHDSVENITKQSDLDDLGIGKTRVLDQKGNLIILPKVNAQSSVTYYQPGEFPFGAANYVPNYEDAVYLSSVGHRSIFTPFLI